MTVICHDGVLRPNGIAVDVSHVSGGRNDVLGVVVRVISLEVCGVGVEFAVVVHAESASKPSPCVEAVARSAP